MMGEVDFAGRIQDDTYRSKFIELPRIIEDWLKPYGGLNGRDILDFGCGEATTAIGIALQHRHANVVGVDIMADVDRCLPLAQAQLGLHQLPSNLSLHRVTAGALHSSEAKFDLIYSWSVFEHIDQRIIPKVLQLLRGALRNDGFLFIQIAPLFYSSEGSHLLRYVPERWGHLLNQHDVYYEKFRDATATDGVLQTAEWSMYRTLNRLTAERLISELGTAGFSIRQQYRTTEEYPIPEPLLQIYREDVLRTNQIVILASKE